jgi:hypothetical protein
VPEGPRSTPERLHGLMKQLVLAGNRQEFEDYCRRNNLGPEQAVFLESAGQLKDTTADSFEFVKLKNWHLNPITNSKEFWDFLSTKRPRFRDAD